MTATDARARSGRRKLVALALLFALPLTIAWALYGWGWRPDSVAARGTLVEPARPIADVALRRADGAAARLGALRGKWLLVYFGAGDCPAACRDQLYKMRQVVLAQGKNAERVARVLVLPESAAAPPRRALLADFPGTEVLSGDAAALRALAVQFALPSGTPPDAGVYVLDPLGNLVLGYPAGADASDLRRDLARLLRVSRIG